MDNTIYFHLAFLDILCLFCEEGTAVPKGSKAPALLHFQLIQRKYEIALFTRMWSVLQFLFTPWEADFALFTGLACKTIFLNEDK